MSKSARRILVVNPILRQQGGTSACDQDRMAGLDHLIRLGYEVRLLVLAARRYPYEESLKFYDGRGYPVTLVPYTYQTVSMGRAADPALLDGEAWAFAQRHFTGAFDRVVAEWRPDVVWCHTTMPWAIARRARLRGIATVIRSTDYGPLHLLAEKGNSLPMQVRAVFKTWSERRAVQSASVMVAISPDEVELYQKIDPGKSIHLLPLRTLASSIKAHPPAANRRPVRAFFMGSALQGGHNRQSLDLLVHEIIPAVRQLAPGVFEFHILGRSVPDEIQALAATDLVLDGFVDDLGAFIETMDIAVMPAPTGSGMQQKIFEALCRGLPVVTNTRAIAGYPFNHDREVLLADDAAGLAQQIVRLADTSLRQTLMDACSRRCHEIFSQDRLDEETHAILQEAMR